MAETEKIVSPELPAAPSPETGAEVIARPETPRPAAEQPVAAPAPVAQPAPAVSAEPLSAEAQQAADIERILESDLSEMYFNLPESKRAEFRAKGESTAREINTLVSTAKATMHKVVSLIRDWLKLIPGINSFFLEQEAKIKADEILKLSNRQ